MFFSSDTSRRRPGFSYVAGTLRVPSAGPPKMARPSRAPVTARGFGRVAQPNGACLRHGFTLVELLVVIAIIGMLVALLLPAVQSARGTARTAQCASQMGELAKATVAYESAKGTYPGYAQFIKRGQDKWATFDYPSPEQRVYIRTTTDKDEARFFTWATMLLRDIERQDIWDQIVAESLTPELRPIEVFICPSDTDATSVNDRPALSYNANTGAWDRDSGGEFLIGDNPRQGDAAENGVMFNVAEYELARKKAPKNRMSALRDGANMTILLTENINKTYEPNSPNDPPQFSWAYGNEQQVGLVWVVNLTPLPGNSITDQEGINRNADGVVDFPSNIPRFARPASSHSGGFNVAFCEGHVQLVSDNIDYKVYQRLLTTNGSKCVDPTGWTPVNQTINDFRTLPPLSEQDFE